MRRKGTEKEGRREEKEGKEAEGLTKEVTSRLNLPSLTMVVQNSKRYHTHVSSWYTSLAPHQGT